MPRKLTPEEKLDEQGRAACTNYNSFNQRCRECAVGGLQRFCRGYQPRKNTEEKGGLF